MTTTALDLLQKPKLDITPDMYGLEMSLMQRTEVNTTEHKKVRIGWCSDSLAEAQRMARYCEGLRDGQEWWVKGFRAYCPPGWQVIDVKIIGYQVSQW